jgi:hypothetical protein
MVAFAVIASAVAACEQSTAAPSAPRSVPARPSPTAGVGFANGTLVRTNLGEINWESNLNGFNVQLKTKDNTDVEVTSGFANARSSRFESLQADPLASRAAQARDRRATRPRG